MNKKEIQTILNTLGLNPQKAKGQNFLVDRELSKKIVSYLGDHSNIIEIGPGLGALTKHLVNKDNVTAVELDRGYAAYLKETYPTINIVERDFLKFIVPRETEAVISNIPYYITTSVIEKVITEVNNLKVFVFMTQSDVSERFFAKCGSKEYGPLAILFSLLGKLERKMTVTKDKFYPVPHVDSAVFTFVRNRYDFDVKDFYRFTKFAFLNRRKQLLKNLKVKYDEKTIVEVFSTLNIRFDVRVEDLNPETIFELYKKIN